MYSKNTNANNLHVTGPQLTSYAVICSKFLNLTWIETLHQHHCTYSTDPSNKIFTRTLFAIESTYLLFCHVSVYEQLFFLFMKLSINIVRSCGFSCWGQFVPPFIFQEELMQYQYNFIQMLKNLFEVCWRWKNADIICYKLKSLVSL